MTPTGPAPATVTPADPPASAVTVARGRPVVTQTARPRERGTTTGADDGSAPAAPGSAMPGAAPVGAGPAVGPAPQGRTGDTERHRRAGRMGGLASYARRTRGARP